MGAGCAPKGLAGVSDGADGNPVAGPLNPEPADAADPHAALLHPTPLAYDELGYGFRLPIGWTQPIDESPSGADFLFRSPDRESVLIIGRRDGTGIRHYGHWLKFCDSFEASVVQMLSEARVISQESLGLSGKLVRLIKHTHYTGGTLRFSAKAAVWMGGEVVIINFETPQIGWEDRLPLFDAFLEEFKILDPARAAMAAYEIDYVAEYRHPERDLTLPVARGFEAAAIDGVDGVLGRWAARPSSVTLAEHRYSGDFMSYARFQLQVLEKNEDLEDVSGEPVEISGRPAYRIEFRVGDESRSRLYIFQSKGYFYQIFGATQPFSFPYLEPLFDDIAAKFVYPEA